MIWCINQRKVRKSCEFAYGGTVDCNDKRGRLNLAPTREGATTADSDNRAVSTKDEISIHGLPERHQRSSGASGMVRTSPSPHSEKDVPKRNRAVQWAGNQHRRSLPYPTQERLRVYADDQTSTNAAACPGRAGSINISVPGSR